MNYVNAHCEEEYRDYTKPALGLSLKTHMQFMKTIVKMHLSYALAPLPCTCEEHIFGQSWNSFLFCDERASSLKRLCVTAGNGASCSHKTLTGGWRVGLWEGHRVPLFGLQ